MNRNTRWDRIADDLRIESEKFDGLTPLSALGCETFDQIYSELRRLADEYEDEVESGILFFLERKCWGSLSPNARWLVYQRLVFAEQFVRVLSVTLDGERVVPDPKKALTDKDICEWLLIDVHRYSSEVWLDEAAHEIESQLVRLRHGSDDHVIPD